MARLVEGTPTDRDRFVDFVRAASLVVVMLGHWTVAVVIREGDTVTATNVLGSARWLQWGTWILQVMPLFFFVGGFSNLRAIDHEAALGGRYPAYLRRRLARLMRPTLVFVGVWLVAVAVLDATALDPDLVRLAGSLAAQPLWFLAVYLMVVALAPPMAATPPPPTGGRPDRAHRRRGGARRRALRRRTTRGRRWPTTCWCSSSPSRSGFFVRRRPADPAGAAVAAGDGRRRRSGGCGCSPRSGPTR